MAKSSRRDSSVIDQSSTRPGPEHGHGSQAYDRDRVARRAYELYLARGGSHGADWDDWLAAERELINARADEQEPGGERER